jgi:hypothetical protein
MAKPLAILTFAQRIQGSIDSCVAAAGRLVDVAVYRTSLTRSSIWKSRRLEDLDTQTGGPNDPRDSLILSVNIDGLGYRVNQRNRSTTHAL